jgi:hypothetical protein
VTENAQESEFQLSEWLPTQHLKCWDSEEVRFSRGFLRCRPEKWFPGFSAHWLPLAHSLGIETRLLEVKSFLRAPKALGLSFYGSVNNERLALFIDQESEGSITNAICPGAQKEASNVVIEYMVRRLFSSLGQVWSGPESSVVEFFGQAQTRDFQEVGAVKLSIALNNTPCHIWLLLSEQLCTRLDGLWRRQIHSTNRIGDEKISIKLELANFFITKNQINTFLKTDHIERLGQTTNDHIVLQYNGKPWLPVRLGMIESTFALETVAMPLSSVSSDDSKERLSVVLGQLELEPLVAAELTQIGAVIDTGISLTSKVQIWNSESKIAEARVFTEQGQFVLKVI